MPEYDNTNRGSLFKNDKGDNAARPEYTGSLNVEGKEYRVAAWVRESKTTGNKFLSLSVQPKDEVKAEPAQADEPIADEIPFNADR